MGFGTGSCSASVSHLDLALLSGSAMVLDRDALEVWKEVPPTGSGIAKVIRCARRFRAWYRSLRLEERRYLEAVSKVVDAIRSPLLLKVVGGLLARLM
ncbi:MAG: hypothetical protein QXO92_03235, partial [Candidatus Bathyarchaeia archaeon]